MQGERCSLGDLSTPWNRFFDYVEPVKLLRGGLALNNLNLTLDIFHDVRGQSALVRKTHLAGESRGRHPAGGVAGVGLFQHPVNLFQGKTLRLRNQEIGVDEAGGAERAPDEEDLGAKVPLVRANHVRCNNSNDLNQIRQQVHVSEVTTGYNLRSSIANSRRWKEQHRGNGLGEGRSLR